MFVNNPAEHFILVRQGLLHIWYPGEAKYHYEEKDNVPARFPSFISISLHEPVELKRGEITIIRHKLGPSDSEDYLVTVTDISTDGVQLTAKIIEPTQIPTFFRRSTTRFGLADAYSTVPNPAWRSIVPMIGFSSPSDIQLDSETSIIRLTEADQLEFGHFLHNYTHEDHELATNPLVSFAICTQLPQEDCIRRTSDVITALRLFKGDHIEPWVLLYFDYQTESTATFFMPLTTRPQNELFWRFIQLQGHATYEVDVEEVEQFKAWYIQFMAAAPQENSPLARAIFRLNRSYTESPAEQLTDCIIGLETLIMVGTKEELRYRIGLRVGFLLSDDPTERIAFRTQVRKAYDERSGNVHSSMGETDETSALAPAAQHYLRRAIMAVCKLDPDVRGYFCKPGKKGEEADRFFESLIATGNLDDAIELWRAGRPQQQQQTKKEREEHPAPNTPDPPTSPEGA